MAENLRIVQKPIIEAEGKHFKKVQSLAEVPFPGKVYVLDAGIDRLHLERMVIKNPALQSLIDTFECDTNGDRFDTITIPEKFYSVEQRENLREQLSSWFYRGILYRESSPQVGAGSTKVDKTGEVI